MFKILMPIDFSESSLNALALATQMTQALHAQLILLHIIEPLGGDATMFIDDHVITDEMKNASEKLEKLKTQQDNIDAPYVETMVEVGFPIDKIINKVDELNVSLVIMGTAGTHSKLTDMLGSNTYKVVKSVQCAVLTVPLHSINLTVKKIALAVDLHKKENIHLLSILRHLLKHFNAHIYFIHICPEEHISLEDDAHTDAILWLASQFKDFEHTFVNIPASDVAQALDDYATRNDVDMIALSPENHGVLTSFFRGSTTRQLVLHTHVPLLTLPADY